MALSDDLSKADLKLVRDALWQTAGTEPSDYTDVERDRLGEVGNLFDAAVTDYEIT